MDNPYQSILECLANVGFTPAGGEGIPHAVCRYIKAAADGSLKEAQKEALEEANNRVARVQVRNRALEMAISSRRWFDFFTSVEKRAAKYAEFLGNI